MKDLYQNVQIMILNKEKNRKLPASAASVSCWLAHPSGLTISGSLFWGLNLSQSLLVASVLQMIGIISASAFLK